jgi:hypothetical protein
MTEPWRPGKAKIMFNPRADAAPAIDLKIHYAF